MMRIDAHHHLWRYAPADFGWIDPHSRIARDFTAEDLQPLLDARALDGAIAVQARQCVEETEALLDCAHRHRWIVGVVGWIDLRAPDVEQWLDRFEERAVVGYRHVVQDEPDADFLLGEAFVRGVRAVLARSLTYDLLVNAAQLGSVPRFMDRVGAGRIVLDHAAKPTIAAGAWQPWADQIVAVAAYPQVFCKVSGLVTEAEHDRWRPDDIERYLTHVFEQFGPDRLIWGSDWPVCLLAATYSQVFDLVADFVKRHCPEAEAAIFGANALRAYGLEECA